MGKSLETSDFKRSEIDARVMLNSQGKDSIIPMILVVDILFESIYKFIIEVLKKKLAGTLEVKIFGPVSRFLGL